MKFKIMAFIAVAASAMLAMAGPAFGSNPNTAGPQDHTWTVSYTSTTAGSHPDIGVVLTLGTLSSPGDADTSFFHDATTTYSGIEPAGSRALPAPNAGDMIGQIGFHIQTNVNLANVGTNNIDPLGTGQEPHCDSTGLPVTVLAATTPIFSASKNAADPTPVSSAPDPATANDPTPQGTANLSFDQEADALNGGRPMGVTHIPDWYNPVLTGLGIPTGQIVGRGMAIATVLVNHTSVSFITVDTGVPAPTPGLYATVTVLGDPRGIFNSTGQTTITCAPFDSTVTNFGTTKAATAANTGTGADWTACKDYFGNALSTYVPAPACTPSAVSAGGIFATTVTSTAGTYPYKIAVSTSADLDNDGKGIGSADNCPVDANASQTDTNSNGIGDACDGLGESAVWVNSTVADGGACTAGTFPTSPPWNVCQDADGDGALNTVDDCPLVPNADLASWLSSGGVSLDNQADNDRDGIGNACDPQPNIPGDGNGYAPVSFTGFPGGGSPAWAAGTYRDYNDVCDQGFTVGGAVSAKTCVTASGTEQGQLDSNNDGIPDVAIVSGACVQDFAADSNGDHYSDAYEASPPGIGALGCTGGVNGINIDPLADAPGCYTNVKLAKSDMNADGNINGLDLSILASAFTKAWFVGSDKNARADITGDHLINGLDLSPFAGNFTKNVAANCATSAFYSTQKNTTYAIAWDRQTAGAHTINIVCTTGAKPISSSTATVVGDAGKYSLPISTTASTGCTFKFDGATLAVTANF